MRFFYQSALIACFLFCGIASAQNLVPNPSFELRTNCPNSLVSMPFSSNYSSFPTVANWTDPVKMSSPDYLHDCASASSGLKVPYTTFGYQQAKTGNAYCGIIAFQGQYTGTTLSYDYREYIQTKLLQPMVAGRDYCVSFNVSPTISANFNYNYVAIDQIGINFSSSRPVDTVNRFMSLPYHIKNSSGNYLTDSSKWYKISGVYKAGGGEEWLTLGSFNNGPPSFINVYPSVIMPNILYWTYMFIDDISVVEITPADTVINVSDTVVCKTAGLNIPLNVNNNAASFHWNNGGISSAMVANDTGTYWCQSQVECGLVVDTFHIRFQPFKKLSLGKDTFNCQSQPVTIGSNTGYSSYLWNTGATTPTLTISQTGRYILTVTDTCGSQKDTIEVAVQAPTPPPVARDTMVCQFASSPQLPAKGMNLNWYLPNMNIGVPTQPYIYTAEPGTQLVYVTQTIGKCESPKVPLTVKVKYKPDAEIGDYFALCAGVDTLMIGHEYPEVNYLWNTNEQVCCIQPRETGTYKLTISNECGTSSDTAFVEIFPCDECIFVPTAFTPNGDGRNDLFLPILKCPISNYSVKIYNRWGELVFTSNNPQAGWNGNNSGDKADMGVYIYVMEYRSVNTNAVKYLKGNITLIR